MIKVIDIDKLFDDYISDFVYKNIGKLKPEEIENKIPVLYVEFGSAKLKELDGKSPEEYYDDFSSAELVECLKEHLEKKVSVSDFLIESLQKKPDAETVVSNALAVDNDEEFTLYLMNVASNLNSSLSVDRYFEFICWDYAEPIKELATEILCSFADKVKDKIVAQFNDFDDATKARFCEILSNASKDDKVFEILVNQFILNAKEIPLYAGYLAKYGDERALPYLDTAIENEKINYVDFEELSFAIEALGGEVKVKRDFSTDKIYKKIKEASKNKN